MNIVFYISLFCIIFIFILILFPFIYKIIELITQWFKKYYNNNDDDDDNDYDEKI